MLKSKDFFRKSQFSLMFALGTLPLSVLILHGFAADRLAVLWMFPAAYVLLAWLCLLLPGKVRLLAALAGSTGLFALGFYILPASQQLLVLLLPLMYVLLLLYGLQVSSWRREDEMHAGWLAAFAVFHVIGQIMISANRRSGVCPIFASAAPALIGSFIACAALALLSLSRSTMLNASMGRQRVPVGMRRRNTIFSMLLLLLILFIAALPEVARALSIAGEYVLAAIRWLILLISRLTSSSSSGGSDAADPDMSNLGGEVSEPSLFALIMEKVVFVIAALAIVALAVFVTIKLVQKLKILVKYLAQRLSQFAQTASEDFEDEVTDTRDEGEKERISLLDSLRRRMIRVDEKQLTPSQRVRYRYLRLMMKHPEWHASQTARETIPTDAAKLYERVRYREDEISTDTADDFAQKLKSL